MYRSVLFEPVVTILALLTTVSICIRYEPDQVLWNLNQNKTAIEVMDYWGVWDNHSELILAFVLQWLIAISIQSIAGQLALPILHYDA